MSMLQPRKRIALVTTHDNKKADLERYPQSRGKLP